MRRIFFLWTLFILFFAVGSWLTAAQDMKPLEDCFIFKIAAGTSGNTGFNDRQKADLAKIFGDMIGYDELIGGDAPMMPADRIYFVVKPSRRQSLFWSGNVHWTYAEGDRVPGFFPKLQKGRLPDKPGEALVSGPQYYSWQGEKQASDIGIEGQKRELGAEFSPYVLSDARFKIVGIAEKPGHSIYVTDFPPNTRASHYQAGALLIDTTRFDDVATKLIQAGVIWDSMRIRNGNHDTSWRIQRWERQFAVSSFAVSKTDGRLRISLTCTYNSEKPLPVSDFAIEIDGEPVSGLFIRGYNDEYPSRYGLSSNHQMDWRGDIAWDGRDHRVGLRIKGILVAIRYTPAR